VAGSQVGQNDGALACWAPWELSPASSVASRVQGAGPLSTQCSSGLVPSRQTATVFPFWEEEELQKQPLLARRSRGSKGLFTIESHNWVGHTFEGGNRGSFLPP
jgi:hypothetical protein